MKRRDFITLVGGAAAAWPVGARAQQSAMPVIGFLVAGSPGPLRSAIAAFHVGLKDTGYVENQNVAVEYRWAEGQYDRLPTLAAELVQRQVKLIVATGGPAPALAAKNATSTIPIVFSSGGDPVGSGLVASLNRPGGNVTGIHIFTLTLEAKRLGILHELIPQASVVAALINPDQPAAQAQELKEAATTIGLQLHILRARNESEINAAFGTLDQLKPEALIVAADASFNSLRSELVVLSARHRIPTIYEWRQFSEAGGLMSYGTILTDAYREVGVYAGRILKGEKPPDLPVLQPTRFELVINLKTAKTLGITVPPNLIARADEVIE